MEGGAGRWRGESLLPGGGRQPHTHCCWMGRTPRPVPDEDAARVSPSVPVCFPGAGGSGRGEVLGKHSPRLTAR